MSGKDGSFFEVEMKNEVRGNIKLCERLISIVENQLFIKIIFDFITEYYLIEIIQLIYYV
jgi:hypothetical protein